MSQIIRDWIIIGTNTNGLGATSTLSQKKNYYVHDYDYIN